MMSRSFIPKGIPLRTRRALSAASIAAIVAAALVTGPASARADSCDQFAFDTPNGIDQSNGWHMSSDLTGKSGAGTAKAVSSSGKTTLTGPVKGDITGRDVYFEANWNNGQVGVYTGKITDDRYASGVVYNASVPGDRADWHATTKFLCVQGPQKPAPPPGPAKRIGKSPEAKPPSEITLRYDPATLVGITAWVGISNNEGKPAVNCAYMDGVSPSRPFTVTGSSETRIDIAGIPTGTKYHITVTCEPGLLHQEYKTF